MALGASSKRRRCKASIGTNKADRRGKAEQTSRREARASRKEWGDGAPGGGTSMDTRHSFVQSDRKAGDGTWPRACERELHELHMHVAAAKERLP